jgi:tRNA U34 2-thiouridine synthase MnmA/TrmU
MAKAITLVSGGLDSALALHLMKRLGVGQIALHCTNIFNAGRSKANDEAGIRRLTDQLGVELVTIDVTDELLELVHKSPHGFGKNMNPCIDCRINMLRHARSIMKTRRAQVIVTGEVLGQRPMSQRRDAMNLVDREAGVKGLVLRPLSAQLLPPTEAERKGLIDRDALLAITGRSRKPQMALAAEFGMTDYNNPAGGCLLTDPAFSNRLRELMNHKGAVTAEDVELIKLGRHFRLDDDTKAVVGRNAGENRALARLARRGDYLFKPTEDVPGPTTLLRGNTTVDNQCYAAELTVKYTSKAEKGGPVTIEIHRPRARKPLEFMTVMAEEAEYSDGMRVG